jgi:hypothetical protein
MSSFVKTALGAIQAIVLFCFHTQEIIPRVCKAIKFFFLLVIEISLKAKAHEVCKRNAKLEGEERTIKS